MFYGPRCLFTNPGRIIDSDTGCFGFGHLKLLCYLFLCYLFLWLKAAFGIKYSIQGKNKRNREEDDGDTGGDDSDTGGDDGDKGGDDNNGC
jgi:hypothetical protein